MKINPKKDMLERIAAFMRKKGMAVSDIEGGLLDMPMQGRLLIVNFLPSDETFSNGIKAIEENARAVISFLVRGKYTRGADRLQMAVNVKSGDACHVLVKYWCDEAKLRELERCCLPFRNVIVRMSLMDVVSGCSLRGVPIEGFNEWHYTIGRREDGAIESALYRQGECKKRFSFTLPETEPIPVERLREQVSRMEYEIQKSLNGRFYALKEVSDVEQSVFDVNAPNLYVLRFIRMFSIATTVEMQVAWLMPMQKVAALSEIVKNERIRVLEVKRFAADEHHIRWYEDGLVWKIDDMCSPTKGNVATSLQEMTSVMERELAACGNDKAYHLVFDCRRLAMTNDFENRNL